MFADADATKELDAFAELEEHLNRQQSEQLTPEARERLVSAAGTPAKNDDTQREELPFWIKEMNGRGASKKERVGKAKKAEEAGRDDGLPEREGRSQLASPRPDQETRRKRRLENPNQGAGNMGLESNEAREMAGFTVLHGGKRGDGDESPEQASGGFLDQEEDDLLIERERADIAARAKLASSMAAQAPADADNRGRESMFSTAEAEAVEAIREEEPAEEADPVDELHQREIEEHERREREEQQRLEREKEREKEEAKQREREKQLAREREAALEKEEQKRKERDIEIQRERLKEREELDLDASGGELLDPGQLGFHEDPNRAEEEKGLNPSDAETLRGVDIEEGLGDAEVREGTPDVDAVLKEDVLPPKDVLWAEEQDVVLGAQHSEGGFFRQQERQRSASLSGASDREAEERAVARDGQQTEREERVSKKPETLAEGDESPEGPSSVSDEQRGGDVEVPDGHDIARADEDAEVSEEPVFSEDDVSGELPAQELKAPRIGWRGREKRSRPMDEKALLQETPPALQEYKRAADPESNGKEEKREDGVDESRDLDLETAEVVAEGGVESRGSSVHSDDEGKAEQPLL